MDSHVWLWMLTTPERLNDSTRTAISTPENEVVLSVASIWEVVPLIAFWWRKPSWRG